MNYFAVREGAAPVKLTRDTFKALYHSPPAISNEVGAQFLEALVQAGVSPRDSLACEWQLLGSVRDDDIETSLRKNLGAVLQRIDPEKVALAQRSLDTQSRKRIISSGY